MLDLTKEEAAALLCQTAYGFYDDLGFRGIKLNKDCAVCPTKKVAADVGDCHELAVDAYIKLKAYIESDISDAEEETLP